MWLTNHYAVWYHGRRDKVNVSPLQQLINCRVTESVARTSGMGGPGMPMGMGGPGMPMGMGGMGRPGMPQPGQGGGSLSMGMGGKRHRRQEEI